MTSYPDHTENIVALKRIEGQIRGVQKMIEEGRYCVDILHQLRSVIRAIASVQKTIYKKHLLHCVTESLSGQSASDKQKKIDEILDLLGKHIA
ncbi:MAG TPA: metal-sensitive transcriptional regulator [Candidatus Omnitrophota bacterium]|nr:metal-sensitive transcriptional regulator [Candidatus Omnitrophota bacterium]